MLAAGFHAVTPKPIPRVLSRHQLLLGAEREPLLVAALICGGTGVSSMTLIGFVTCGAIWGGALMALRWMAKADPCLSKIYVKSTRYSGFYPAFSRPYRRT